MTEETIKSVHLTKKTHDLLIEKQKHIYNKTKINMKLSDLADIIIKINIEKFEPEMILQQT